MQLYLQRYGYMQAHTNAEANNLISEESFSEAVSSFQRFAGIPETGECFGYSHDTTFFTVYKLGTLTHILIDQLN